MPTSVRLDPEIQALLARLAAERGTSKSDVVREALVAYGAARQPAAGDSVWERVRHLVGRYPSGRGDLSQDTGDRVHDLLRADAAARRHRR